MSGANGRSRCSKNSIPPAVNSFGLEKHAFQRVAMVIFSRERNAQRHRMGWTNRGKMSEKIAPTTAEDLLKRVEAPPCVSAVLEQIETNLRDA
ncbi:MAG: hypothetical protein M3N93_11325, partial [Acidobacteriota bacterium]|nr:hypothetical protein [Acidobacteriota bacterium]